jgi:hypothetical protein
VGGVVRSGRYARPRRSGRYAPPRWSGRCALSRRPGGICSVVAVWVICYAGRSGRSARSQGPGRYARPRRPGRSARPGGLGGMLGRVAWEICSAAAAWEVCSAVGLGDMLCRGDSNRGSRDLDLGRPPSTTVPGTRARAREHPRSPGSIPGAPGASQEPRDTEKHDLHPRGPPQEMYDLARL